MNRHLYAPLPKRRLKRSRSLKPTAAQLTAPDDELPEGATRFERAQHYGARRHTAMWIQANQAAIDVANILGFDHTTQLGKTLLATVTLRVLDVAVDGKTGRI